MSPKGKTGKRKLHVSDNCPSGYQPTISKFYENPAITLIWLWSPKCLQLWNVIMFFFCFEDELNCKTKNMCVTVPASKYRESDSNWETVEIMFSVFYKFVEFAGMYAFYISALRQQVQMVMPTFHFLPERKV